MSYYKIVGGKPIVGEVLVRGAKNASFKEIIAALLTEKPVDLLNVPVISDISITKGIAKNLGVEIVETGTHSLRIVAKDIRHTEIPAGTGEKSRTSFMFAGPLLARRGAITFPIPGGDKLGTRPLDRLFECLRKMNVEIKELEDRVEMTTEGLVGCEYTFPKPSHTATEVVLMTAVTAKGDTIIRNAAREPEIDDMIEMLSRMGASLMRDPKDASTIYVHGVKSLMGTTHQVIADRNEAVTFACAALCTKGRVNIMRINPQIIETFLKTIEQMGAEVKRGTDEVEVAWVAPLRAINIETEPEPGFMTDWQAVFSLLLSQARGASSVIEKIFPYRFHHIEMMNKLGVKTAFFNPEISDENFDSYYHFNRESNKPEYFHGVKIYGPAKLKPTNLEVKDLRAGATATIAALTAEGESRIDGVEFIERGYEKLAERLAALGAHIEVVRV